MLPVKDGAAAAQRAAGEPIFLKRKLGGPLILEGERPAPPYLVSQQQPSPAPVRQGVAAGNERRRGSQCERAGQGRPAVECPACAPISWAGLRGVYSSVQATPHLFAAQDLLFAAFVSFDELISPEGVLQVRDVALQGFAHVERCGPASFAG